ncbi:MAG: hypothetical protein HQL29_05915, partial [Candidatus Omnitrophica bacterium]|nr:hypothetical protein [Candidatus Omnitrophota bacterium]
SYDDFIKFIGAINAEKMGIVRGAGLASGIDNMFSAVEYLRKNMPEEEITFSLITETMKKLGFETPDKKEMWLWFSKQSGEKVDAINKMIDDAKGQKEKKYAKSFNLTVEQFRARAEKLLEEKLGIPVKKLDLSETYTTAARIIVMAYDDLGHSGMIPEISEKTGLTEKQLADFVGVIGWPRAELIGLHRRGDMERPVIVGKAIAQLQADILDIKDKTDLKFKITIRDLYARSLDLGMNKVVYGTFYNWIRSPEERHLLTDFENIAPGNDLSRNAVLKLSKMTSYELRDLTEEKLQKMVCASPDVWREWARIRGFDFKQERAAYFEKARLYEERLERAKKEFAEFLSPEHMTEIRMAEIAQNITVSGDEKEYPHRLFAFAKKLDEDERSQESANRVYGRLYNLMNLLKTEPALKEEVRKIIFNRYEDKRVIPKKKPAVRNVKTNAEKYEDIVRSIETSKDPKTIVNKTNELIPFIKMTRVLTVEQKKSIIERVEKVLLRVCPDEEGTLLFERIQNAAERLHVIMTGFLEEENENKGDAASEKMLTEPAIALSDNIKLSAREATKKKTRIIIGIETSEWMPDTQKRAMYDVSTNIKRFVETLKRKRKDHISDIDIILGTRETLAVNIINEEPEKHDKIILVGSEETLTGESCKDLNAFRACVDLRGFGEHDYICFFEMVTAALKLGMRDQPDAANFKAYPGIMIETLGERIVRFIPLKKLNINEPAQVYRRQINELKKQV